MSRQNRAGDIAQLSVVYESGSNNFFNPVNWRNHKRNRIPINRIRRSRLQLHTRFSAPEETMAGFTQMPLLNRRKPANPVLPGSPEIYKYFVKFELNLGFRAKA